MPEAVPDSPSPTVQSRHTTSTPTALAGRPATRMLAPVIGLYNLGLIAATLGFTTVLLPNQLTLLDPENKVANLALISSVSMIAGVVGQPVFGAISDRLRSRFGRRMPFIVASGILAAVSLLVLSMANSVLLILILASVIQVAVAMGGAPLVAIVADRYPIERRGWVSAWIGLGLNAGYAVGVFGAGMLASDLRLAYVVLGLTVAAALTVFSIIARDNSSLDMVLPASSWQTVLRGFWINPIRHPDFTWAFVARFFYILAYFVVFNFQFFILTDFIGLSLDEANVEIGGLAILALAPGVIASYATGWLADKLGRRKVFLYISCAFTAFGYASQLAWPTIEGQYAMVILTSIGFGMYLTSDTVIMTQVLPDAGGAAAKDLGILNLATALPQALSALLAAYLLATFGGYEALFYAGGAIAILGGVSALFIRRVK